MRAHFPGALREMRFAACPLSCPLHVNTRWWRASASAARDDARVGSQGWIRSSRQFYSLIRKEHKHVEEGLTTAAGGACPRESGAKKHGNRSQVPGSGRRSQPHAGWGHDECGVVAESTESEYPASALPPVRSYGQGFQLCGGIQEPRPECGDQGSACLDDGLAGLVAGRLWPLRTAIHSHGMAQRRHVSHLRRPRRRRGWPDAFRAAQ